jgi:hypothetical protein
MGLAVLAGVSASAATGAGAPQTAGPFSARPADGVSDPQPEMSELDFLLGSFSCVEVAAPGQTFPTTYSTIHTAPVLGGAFYEMKLDGHNAPDGQWYFGYDQSNSVFDTEYIDSTGSHGSSTSPGPQNGHMAFDGTYIFPSYGVSLTVQDSLSAPDKNTLMDDESKYVGGQWVLKTITTCKRIDK